MSPAITPYELKQFIIDALDLEDTRPEDIVDDEPLFVDGLGLDSIDGLELNVALKKKFNVEVVDEGRGIWGHTATVRSLMVFLSRQDPIANDSQMEIRP